MNKALSVFIIIYMLITAFVNMFIGESYMPHKLGVIMESAYFAFNALCLVAMSMYFIINGFLHQYRHLFMGLSILSVFKFVYEIVLLTNIITNEDGFRDGVWSILCFIVILFIILYIKHGIYKK